jgi:hypothetical protein
MPPTPSPKRTVPASDAVNAQMAIDKPQPIFVIHQLSGISRLKMHQISAK